MRPAASAKQIELAGQPSMPVSSGNQGRIVRPVDPEWLAGLL